MKEYFVRVPLVATINVYGIKAESEGQAIDKAVKMLQENDISVAVKKIEENHTEVVNVEVVEEISRGNFWLVETPEQAEAEEEF